MVKGLNNAIHYIFSLNIVARPIVNTNVNTNQQVVSPPVNSQQPPPVIIQLPKYVEESVILFVQ